MRKTLVATTTLIAVLAMGLQPVGAVNGDLDGNAHPNVGVMLVQDANGDIFEFCGGVLISPTVFLTNYNCPGAVAFAESIGGRAVVTFEPVLPWPPEGSGFQHRRGGVRPPRREPQERLRPLRDRRARPAVLGITPAQLPTLQQLASIGKGEPLTDRRLR